MKYPIQFHRVDVSNGSEHFIGEMTLDNPKIDQLLIERIKRVSRQVDPLDREVRAYNLITKQYV